MHMGNRIFALIYLIVALSMSLSCTDQKGKDNDEIIVSASLELSPDTLIKWKLHSESSSEGLWENQDIHSVSLERIATYGGEEDLEPPFFTADYFSVSGDSIFVSDDPGQRLVCLTLDGEVQWRAGEVGEGPGHFLGIARSDVSEEYVAVCNNGGCAIDLYSRSGGFVRRLSTISGPQDVKFLSDTTLLVFSKSENGGDIHIMDIDTGEILDSFGDGEWTIVTRNYSPRDLTGIISSENNRVAYLSQFEHRLMIYDIETRSLIFRGARQLPSESHNAIETEDDEGTRRGMLFPVPGIVFLGPELMINITMPQYMSDGRLLGPSDVYDYAPVTLVDRYNWEGIYLDSYCIPDSIVSDVYYSDDYGFIGRQRDTEVIHLYSMNAEE